MARAQEIRGLNARAAIRASLPLMFSTRIAELWGWSEHLQYPERVRELHDMRIAAKRLRYLFEFFEPCFTPDFKEHLKHFKQLQDYLGEIHDCDVWVDYLRDQLAGAFKELNQARKALGQFTGAGPELGPAAAELRGQLAQGPVQGLLMMMADVVDRRDRIYGELLGFWDRLEKDQFRATLIGAVAEAARGNLPPQAGN